MFLAIVSFAISLHPCFN
jgi:hypothetical protein